ncbi:hypothetical protein [Sinorhizobium fredii]|uniref:hypothetical protein n=1 Tax=Rhizobium fredii TaxID=380 RepID=UPI0005956062|nr:hypothetical protein [Sinorhizobium fredii]WOS62033.1 hypothetical protein SFGR64A_13910 [Sinorhizobium fredii GR64]
MLPAKRKEKSLIARALDRLAKRQDSPPVRQESRVAPAVRNEDLFIVQRCAVTGERFKTLFTRRADGKFVAKAQVKIEELFSGFSADDGTAAPSANIRSEDIAQMPDGPCPCCGRRLDYQHVQCGTCHELVCTGRSYEDEQGFMFVCHAGCGARGSLTGRRIPSYTAEPVEAPAARPALTQEKRPSLPSGKTKLLGRRS